MLICSPAPFVFFTRTKCLFSPHHLSFFPAPNVFFQSPLLYREIKRNKKETLIRKKRRCRLPFLKEIFIFYIFVFDRTGCPTIAFSVLGSINPCLNTKAPQNGSKWLLRHLRSWVSLKTIKTACAWVRRLIRCNAPTRRRLF